MFSRVQRKQCTSCITKINDHVMKTKYFNMECFNLIFDRYTSNLSERIKDWECFRSIIVDVKDEKRNVLPSKDTFFIIIGIYKSKKLFKGVSNSIRLSRSKSLKN